MYYAITMNRIPGKDNVPRDELYADYSLYFQKLGCTLIYVPNTLRITAAYFEDLPISGVILSGGNDLSAEFTGLVEKDIRNPSNERDNVEKDILNEALRRNLPVLGICRGMQFINCYFGGSVTQDIETEIEGAAAHVRRVHDIHVTDLAAARFWRQDRLNVNSYHHQGIQSDQVALPLEVLALSMPDQIVEALYHPTKPVLGIQWHPERELGCSRKVDEFIRAFLDGRVYNGGGLS